MNDKPMQAGKYYQIGKLRFEHQPNGLWGVGNGSHGVSNHKSPFAAYRALRRWTKG